jgi:hypothetical protein
VSDLWNDIKHALQMFLKNPSFTVAAVAALALGIGANTAIFSVVNAVLLKPLGYPDADRIVEFLAPSSVIVSNLSNVPELHFYQRQTSVFQDVAAYDMAGSGFNLTGDRPEQLQGIHVTEGYFRLFGAPVMLGRTFTPQEDSPHGGKVVVMSYGLWRRRFGGDPHIVGKPLSLGNERFTIVGVIGKQFDADPPADIWLPFQFEPVSNDMNNYFHVAALLRPGVTVAQANAQLMAAAPEYHREFPTTNPRRIFAVGPLRDTIVGDVRGSLMVMLGAVGLVLLIACANVANLLLVRAAGRKREFAIRSALGARRARIVRQLLTESVMMSSTGGILGLVLGMVGVRALLAVSPAGLPRIGESGSAVSIDWRVLGFTLGISLLTGIVFGLFPALSASRTDLNSTLKESSIRSGTGFRQGKARSLLVISEVSLALVSLIGAALLIRTFIALHGVNLGFDPHNVLSRAFRSSVLMAELSGLRTGGRADPAHSSGSCRCALHRAGECGHRDSADDRLFRLPADHRGVSQGRRQLHRGHGQPGLGCWAAGGRSANDRLHSDCIGGDLSRRRRVDLGSSQPAATYTSTLSWRAGDSDLDQHARGARHRRSLHDPDVSIHGNAADRNCRRGVARDCRSSSSGYNLARAAAGDHCAGFVADAESLFFRLHGNDWR